MNRKWRSLTQSTYGFCKLTKVKGVKHTLIAPHCTWSNGQVLFKLLSIFFKVEESNAKLSSVFVQLSSANSTQGQTSAELFLNLRLEISLDLLRVSPNGKPFSTSGVIRNPKWMKVAKNASSQLEKTVSSSRLLWGTKMAWWNLYRAGRPFFP